MSLTTRQEQAAAVKTIGARMRAARELCNLSQSAAARRLGYANPSKLSKVELATDTNSVPLWLIVRAARVYEVSVDFLFGATDDWEVGARMTQEREVSAWMFDAWEKARQRDMETLKRLHDRVQTLTDAVAVMLAASEDSSLALARFAELNPEFEEMRAGSRLVGAVERANESAKAAKTKMERFRMECAVAAPQTHQLSLAL
ncbi:helix-turn-helix domain-containing protein [Pandoraea apista]|uniref:helix-turn-helix domain-containing protein n=1 Tax=Pandoraea apista TaxID=93218 RepID=UPI001EE6362D|nr:helix-turn-helix transcriptional regulator [Pandoraea apista]